MILTPLKRIALILLWIRYLCQKCFRENRATTLTNGVDFGFYQTGKTSFRAAGSTPNSERNKPFRSLYCLFSLVRQNTKNNMAFKNTGSALPVEQAVKMFSSSFS